MGVDYGPGVVVVVVVGGVVVVGAAVVLVPVPVEVARGAAVPCGRSSRVYRVPSAVLTRVTAWFTLSVRVDWPVAYEPPAIATCAVVAVSETSWKYGVLEDAGKSEPVVTDSETPLIEITADVGGGVGGDGGVTGGVVPPPDVPDLPELPELPLEPEPDELLEAAAASPLFGPRESNGSLLAKLENDWSCPASAEG